MRATTDWRDAVDDPGNRAAAAEQICKEVPDLWNGASEATRGQWVTDRILESMEYES